MAEKFREQWVVSEHGAWREHNAHLWSVDAPVPGMALRRVMAVAKMADGALVIHNGIPLRQQAMEQLEGWGQPRYLVVPNALHRLDARAYKKRYPELEVVCPKAARSKVTECLPVDIYFRDFPDDPHVSFLELEGTHSREGVMRVDDEEGCSLIFNDAIFNMPHAPGFGGMVVRYVFGSSGGPRVSRLAGMLLVKDREAFAEELRELSQIPDLRRVLVAHHEVIEDEPGQILRQIADSL